MKNKIFKLMYINKENSNIYWKYDLINYNFISHVKLGYFYKNRVIGESLFGIRLMIV